MHTFMLHFHQFARGHLRCCFRQFGGLLQADGRYFLAGSAGTACPTVSSWTLAVLQGLVPSPAQDQGWGGGALLLGSSLLPAGSLELALLHEN